LVEVRKSDIKEIILGKITISKTNQETNEENDRGKSKLKISNLNELAYAEFMLSIDVRTSSGKEAFNMLNGFKNKVYTEVNTAMSQTQILLW
jgi:hypothetical protein